MSGKQTCAVAICPLSWHCTEGMAREVLIFNGSPEEVTLKSQRSKLWKQL